MGKHRENHVEPEQAHGAIVALTDRLTPLEGVNRTLVEDVTLLRRSKSIPRRPVLHEPSIVFVVQGRKRGYISNHQFKYDARTVLILSAPIPFECISEAPLGKPLLSVYVRLRREVVLDLLSNMREPVRMRKPQLRAIEETRLDEALSSALLRLLTTLTSPDDARVLGAQSIRELIYLVLKREEGDGVRAMIETSGHVAQIYKTLQRIHNEYSKPLTIAALARQVGMSVSTFHLHFKQVTLTSPIQYIKAVRMHEARVLMLDSEVSASVAASRVGYKSASQFGREFKRFFGSSPSGFTSSSMCFDLAGMERIHLHSPPRTPQ